MDAHELLLRLRSDMGMTELEYNNFCKRYAARNISTVMWYLSKLYGKLPKGIDKTVRIEMSGNNSSVRQK